ncbi:uncharacterized protein LOC129738334 [Uranotaenia lowii]|uniref:uncharacterized protein LOC129738334 n=1 Tax=Uranotaenia lowii TaxID=190385 RepID=UPI002478F8A7|nr:uncharacterized protein LOC129738334 [Uranotaenia lowii]
MNTATSQCNHGSEDLKQLVAEQTPLEEKKKLMEKHFSILEELVDLEDEETAEEEVDADAKVQNWLGAAGGKCQEEGPSEEEVSGNEEDEDIEETDFSDDSEEKEQEDSSDGSTEDELGRNNNSTFNPKDRFTPAKKGVSKLRKQQQLSIKPKPDARSTHCPPHSRKGPAHLLKESRRCFSPRTKARLACAVTQRKRICCD